jgi:hypothetical protein
MAGPTRLLVAAVLFGAKVSVLVVLTEPVTAIVVPVAVPQFTRRPREKTELAPAAKGARVQVTVPVPPKGGVVHVQPTAE